MKYAVRHKIFDVFRRYLGHVLSKNSGQNYNVWITGE